MQNTYEMLDSLLISSSAIRDLAVSGIARHALVVVKQKTWEMLARGIDARVAVRSALQIAGPEECRIALGLASIDAVVAALVSEVEQ